MSRFGTVLDFRPTVRFFSRFIMFSSWFFFFVWISLNIFSFNKDKYHKLQLSIYCIVIELWFTGNSIKMDIPRLGPRTTYSSFHILFRKIPLQAIRTGCSHWYITEQLAYDSCNNRQTQLGIYIYMFAEFQ